MPTKNLTATAITRTYTLTLDSCESRPKIVASFEAIPEDKVKRAFEFASKNFRDVQVTCDQTGEIIFNHYVDCDWFEPIYNYGEAIDYLMPICYNPEF